MSSFCWLVNTLMVSSVVLAAGETLRAVWAPDSLVQQLQWADNRTQSSVWSCSLLLGRGREGGSDHNHYSQLLYLHYVIPTAQILSAVHSMFIFLIHL